ncbi:MAG TPA: glycosyltransferase family 2 protein [Trueperaceae bacterium]
MPSHLSVLVLHHKTPQLLQQCLKRLCDYSPEAHITVVDTGPAEAAESLVRRDFPGVRLLKAANYSMAHAVNCGLKTTRTPFVCHMNADVLIEADTLSALLDVVKEDGVGMAGPLCLTAEGVPQDQGLPYRRFYRRLAHTHAPSLAVPWLSGCMQVVTRDVLLAVGGMDGSLRFYNEDTEWCWRLGRAGYACHLAKTSVVHLGGRSTPDTPAFLIEGFRGGYRLSQRYKSPLYRSAHRWAVLAMAAWQQRALRDPAKRQAYAEIAAMFRQRRFDVSPFGASLAEHNPAFPGAIQPAR